MKIAITSTGGEYIDTHFGKAEKVLVYEISKSGHMLLEVRNIERYCSPDKGHGFDAKKFEAIYESIKDCSKLYTMQIGGSLTERFLEKGIVVKASDSEIDRILRINE